MTHASTCARALAKTLLLRIAAEMTEHAEHPTRMANGAWARAHLTCDDKELQAIELGFRGNALLMIYWIGEWGVVFGWALGITPSVPPPETVGDFEALAAAVPLPPTDPQAFFAAARWAADEARLRAEAQRLVAVAEDWFARYPKLPKDKDLVIARSRAIERGRAAGWLLRLLDNHPEAIALQLR